MIRVLIVDDSIIMRRNIENVLKEAGYDVVGQAINGKQAIEMYEKLKPDLVTMDISMPLMNGIDAVSEIIKIDANAKIVMISAHNQKQMVFEAIKNGAKHYILKPIEVENVVKVINAVLGSEKIK